MHGKVLGLLALISLLGAGPAPAAAPDRPRNIILIGWDGAQRAHLKECLERQELPNLRRLCAEGTLVAIDITKTTDTKAGWAQILTGYEPEVTGVYNNRKFQPIPKGYTVFERLEDHFGKRKFVTVAVIGKGANVGAAGPKKKRLDTMNRKQRQRWQKNRKKRSGKAVTEGRARYWVTPGEPFHNARDRMDVYINALGQDRRVGSRTLELLEEYRDKPFFFFVHFAEVDHQGHKFGENSKEYNDAMISADTWTGKLMDKLKELKIHDETLIYVTSDHGFDEGTKKHSDAPYVFLGTNDPKVVTRGLRRDIAPTILQRFGLNLKKIRPPLDGVPLTKLKGNW